MRDNEPNCADVYFTFSVTLKTPLKLPLYRSRSPVAMELDETLFQARILAYIVPGYVFIWVNLS
jgi:hypothetical protein